MHSINPKPQHTHQPNRKNIDELKSFRSSFLIPHLRLSHTLFIMLSTSKILGIPYQKRIVSVLLCSLSTHSTMPLNSCLHLRRSFRFSRKCDGFISGSCVFGYNPANVYIAYLSVGTRILPLIAVMSSFKGLCKSVVTQSCPDSAKTTEIIDQVLCIVENSASSIKEIRDEIGRLCLAGSVSVIADLLQLLHSKRIVLGSDALEILLSATSKRCDVELSLQIFRDLVVSSKCLSSKSYRNLAEAFINTDNCDDLLKCVREISECTDHTGVLILNRIIFAFGEARQIGKAIVIFNYMKSLKCKPDLVTYNTILGILGQTGRLDEMLQEFTSMKEADIIPDVVTYNTLLNILQKFGRFDLCLTYMREMYEKGVNLDLRTYTALIESFGRSGHIDEALRIFDIMKERQVRPSIYIYRSLINNLKKVGKLEAAASLLHEMNYSLPYLIGPKDFKRKYR